MPPPAVLAIDQGTTSVRASVVDDRLSVRSSRAESVARHFPRPGWVELDAEEVVAATDRVARAAIDDAACRSADIAAVALANQGETIVVWDRASGRAVGPAVGWQCRRTERSCAALRRDGVERWVRERTGLRVDPYFSATKLAWILDELPGGRARAERGELVAGTLDAYTLFRLSSGRLHVTDPSTACRTLLARLEDGRFDDELCALFRVPQRMLPEVVASDASLGAIAIGGIAADVRGILCDQPSALLGTGCVAPGDLKCTYGTGAFVQIHTGGEHRRGDDGLLRSIAWELGGRRCYLLEGSVLAAGDVLTWLRDGLGIIAGPDAIDELLARTPDTAGVLFAPALTGLGAPRWAGEARGTLLGLHRGARREHIIRAALEGVAHQVADVLEVAGRTGRSLSAMWADGGLALSRAFLQLQADIAGLALRRAAHVEATTRGVAAIAAVASGLAESHEAIVVQEPQSVVRPALSERERRTARGRHRRLLDVATCEAALACTEDPSHENASAGLDPAEGV